MIINFLLKYLLISILFIYLSINVNNCFAQQKKTEKGIASYYADSFNGRTTASGEVYSQDKLTAAHPTLPFNTKVKITNLSNQKQVVVRINDRGPFIGNRIIDLSRAAAEVLGYVYAGLTKVKLEVLKMGESGDIKLATVEKKVVVKKIITQKDALPEIKKDSIFLVQTKSMNGYGVQLMSFSSKDNWLIFQKKFQKNSKKTLHCQEVTLQSKKYYRAIAGGFITQQAAEDYKKSIQSLYPGCFVVYF
ncbi:MAG: septal ring lytic transglycosylase RlpA family protein [Bacteroidota bacterium]